MNTASRLLAASMLVALAACGKSTQSDVNKAAHDSAVGVAKARQDAQPAVDAANRGLANAQQNANIKVADANANADLAVNKAAVKQSKEQARADYDVAMAKIDGDLSVAIEKCRMLSADARSACEQNAHSIHDQSATAAKAQLDLVDQQPSQ